MKPVGHAAMLLLPLIFVQGCGTLGSADDGSPPGVARAVTVSTLTDGSTRIVVSTDDAFDYGSIVLHPAVAGELLVAAGPHLQERATVSGHTDNVGAAAYNLTLSRQRAQSIANALILHGASAERLTITGHGESNPRASNETEAGRALNRRVEVLFESLN